MEGISMKQIIKYGSFFVLFYLAFVLCYYLSYQRALEQYNTNTIERKEEFLTDLLQDTEENTDLLKKLGLQRIINLDDTLQESEIVVVDTLETDTILPSTKYILETYDVVTDTLITEELVPPGVLVGKNRKEIVEYMKEYMNPVPLQEYEKGLVSYELRSFSTDKLVMRKTYDESLLPYKFYVNIVNDYVTVYYSDLKTVYEYTQICAAELSEEARLALSQGIFVKDREELYGLLEGYSS